MEINLTDRTGRPKLSKPCPLIFSPFRKEREGMGAHFSGNSKGGPPAPNSQVKKVIDLNKQKYPEMKKKPNP